MTKCLVMEKIVVIEGNESNWTKKHRWVECRFEQAGKAKVGRQTLVSPTEACTTTKSKKGRLDVNEMRTLRWMCGVTKTCTCAIDRPCLA